MGKRGPRPLPTAIKKQRGTHQKCRDAPDALELPAGVPTRPGKLGRDAEAIWDELVAHEDWRLVLAKADGLGLELLVKHMALERRYATDAERRPMVKTPWGPKPNPAASEARKEAAIVKQLLAEFGLTASSRSRVSAPKKESPKDPAESFLFNGPKLAVVK